MNRAPFSRRYLAWLVLMSAGCASPSRDAPPVPAEPQRHIRPQEVVQLSEAAAMKLRDVYGGADAIIEVSADGGLVAVGSGSVSDGCLDVWDADLGTKLYSLDLSWGVGSRFAFSGDGQELAACTEYSVVTIHDARSGAEERRLPTPAPPDCLVFPGDGQMLVTGHGSPSGSTAVLWSLESGEQLRGFPRRVKARRGHPDPSTQSSEEILSTIGEIAASSLRGPQHIDFMYALAVHPSGSIMVTIGQAEGSEILQVWSMPSGKLLQTPYVQGARVTCAAFSPDGGYLAAGTLENTILLWETTDWSIHRTLGQRRPPTKDRTLGITRFYKATSVAFSPDGRRLASGHSGSRDLIRLWDCTTGEKLDSYASSREPRRYEANALGFVNGDRLLMASGADFVSTFFVADGLLEPFPIVGMSRSGSLDRQEAAGALLSAVRDEDLERVRALLATGTDPNHPSERGQTPLWVAAGIGDLELVTTLMAAGADVNGRSVGKATPLWFAAQKGHVEVARLIIENGAEVDAADQLGGTALQWAAHFGHIEVIELLLESGADVNVRRKSGGTALSMARTQGHEDVVRLLRNAGARGE